MQIFPLPLKLHRHRPRNTCEYLRSHTILQAIAASERDAALLEVQDNILGTKTCVAVTQRFQNTSQSNSDTHHSLSAHTSNSDCFPQYEFGETTVCLAKENCAHSPDMPRLAEKGYNAWKPVNTIDSTAPFTANGRQTRHDRQSRHKRRRSVSPELIDSPRTSQRSIVVIDGSTQVRTTPKKQKYFSRASSSDHEIPSWETPWEEHNIQAAGEVLTKAMHSSHQSSKEKKTLGTTPLGSTNEFRKTESIVRPKRTEGSRRELRTIEAASAHEELSGRPSEKFVSVLRRTSAKRKQATSKLQHCCSAILEVDEGQVGVNSQKHRNCDMAEDTSRQSLNGMDMVDEISESAMECTASKSRIVRNGSLTTSILAGVIIPTKQSNESALEAFSQLHTQKSPKLHDFFVRHDAAQPRRQIDSMHLGEEDSQLDELQQTPPSTQQLGANSTNMTTKQKRHISVDSIAEQPYAEASDTSINETRQSNDIRPACIVRTVERDNRSVPTVTATTGKHGQGPTTSYALKAFYDNHGNHNGLLNIVYRNERKVFEILDGQACISEINSKKINTVTFGNFTRAEFLGSTISGMGQYWVHLEFRSSDSLKDFRENFEITIAVSRINEKSDSHLEKALQNRIGRRLIADSNSMSPSKSAMEEVALVARRVANGRSQEQKRLDTPSPSHLKIKDGMKSNTVRRAHTAPSSDIKCETSNIRISSVTEGAHSPTMSGPIARPELQLGDDKQSFSIHGHRPAWTQPVVFPPVGPNKTTVDFEDLSRLDEGEFLNDSLISFCLRYAQFEHPQSGNSVHIFNTYFYTSLTKQVKGQKGINYDLVKRWTSKVDLFEKDYVVVPINQNLHWYVAIICNLRNFEPSLVDGDLELTSSVDRPNDDTRFSPSPEPPTAFLEDVVEKPNTTVEDQGDVEEKALASETKKMSLNDETLDSVALHQTPPADELMSHIDQIVKTESETTTRQAEAKSPNKTAATSTSQSTKATRLRKYDPKKPIIITLDSFGFSHSDVTRNLREYIAAEAMTKRQMVARIENGMTAKGIPEQENYSDCGLYVVGYILKFLRDPAGFVQKILQREMNECTDWPGFSSSKLRGGIRRTLQKEYEKQEADRQRLKRQRVALGKLKQSAAPSPSREKQDNCTQSNCDGPMETETPKSNLQSPVLESSPIHTSDHKQSVAMSPTPPAQDEGTKYYAVNNRKRRRERLSSTPEKNMALSENKRRV